MAKRKAPKTITKKNAKKKAGPKAAKAKRPNPTPSSLKKWMSGVRSLAITGESTGKPRGACLVANPGGGPRMCINTDRDTCKAIKGTFIGGPC